MDYKEKVIELLKSNDVTDEQKEKLRDIFPELKEGKESEDESIIRDIRVVLESSATRIFKENGQMPVWYDRAVAWLEAQGEHANFRNKIQIGDKVTRNEAGILVNRSQLDRVAKKRRKQDEQKPADKTEPKFRNGQWIVWQDKCYKVNYNGCGYELVDQNGLSTSLEYGTIDENAHIWDTKDAKDGYVLADKTDGVIGIFQSIGHHPDGGSYNDPSYCFLHCRYDDGYFYADFENGNTMDSDDAIPATKEQRDTLEKAIADAGYRWDKEKLKLEKI